VGRRLRHLSLAGPVAGLTALSLVVTSPGTASAANTASAPGVTAKTITIGMLSDVTGAGASSFADAIKGVDARFKLQNSMGGINGRKLDAKSLDTQSSATTVLTAAQVLVQQDNVFAVMPESVVFTAAYRYLNQQQVPVVGLGFDGPEWGDPTNGNMFSFSGGGNPHYPANTAWGKIFKAVGVTNLGVAAYGNSASSNGGGKEIASSVKAVGINVGYQDFSIPLGGTNVTSTALGMKNAGVNGVATPTTAATALALLTALQQNGAKVTPVLASLYGPTALTDPGVSNIVQGAFVVNRETPFEEDIPATRQAAAALKKYENYTADPDNGIYIGYIMADLVIKGLQVAGNNPTRASFINNLHKVKSYDAGGLLAGKVNFSPKLQGTWIGDMAGNCDWLLKVEGSKFVPFPAKDKPFCGTNIAGTNNA
jgi:branched-chain amino acid transport system substrate-binding protein